MSFEKKPFYLNPPWNILFNPNQLRKARPWDINIAFVLTSFIKEMEKLNKIDFRASGVILNSSAFIYLMKSKLLLKLEEPTIVPKATFNEIALPPLFIPLRCGLTSTTIMHLLQALSEVLKSESRYLSVNRLKAEPITPMPSEVILEVDKYLIEIKKQMEKLYYKLKIILRKKPVIAFSELVDGFKKLEAIKTFILLLFLAQKEKISLWQEKEFEEIYITMSGDYKVNEESF